MAVGYGVPVPKGKTRKQLKARKDREDAKALKAFRDAVWLRECVEGWRMTAGCQRCGRIVVRGSDYRPGEVHHIIGRRAKATRYDPANGVLLCRDCHRKETEHR